MESFENNKTVGRFVPVPDGMTAREFAEQLQGTQQKPKKAPAPIEQGHLLPTDPHDRKEYPVATGVLDYFPAAIVELAKVSYNGNKQHNPGEPLHWARNKSTDQADTIIRHFLERGTLDTDGQRHSAKLAWRALALLQLELEAEGAPIARNASYEG